jgi:phytol kinase
MTAIEVLGLLLSYVYAFGLLLIVESVGKKLSWSQSSTRKIIHIGAGMWVWGILAFFDHWYFGIIPFATFIILNYLFYKKQSFTQMDDEKSTPGTVYFAFSITLLFLLFWRTDALIDRVQIAVAAVMAMTLGDAFAAIIGQKWGRGRYTIMKATRTLTGSLAMLIFSFIGIFISLYFIPGSTLSPNSAVLSIQTILAYSTIAALSATLFEALSPSGTDNLTVPLLTGFILFLLIG